MSLFLAEFIGTALLMVFGCGVVANVVLDQTKGSDGGWIVITWGWGMGVFVGVFTVSQFSGAHINPAVTFGLATAGLFDWALVPTYITAQMAGAAFGASLVWLAYRDHFAATADPDLKLAVFCTAPNIRRYPSNVITEVIGTIVLVMGVLFLVEPGFVLVETGEFLKRSR